MSSELVLDALSEQEARKLVLEIKGHLYSARYKLYRLWSGQGWLALGYDSWDSCLQAEFESHRSYLYRQVAAAKLEAAAGLEIDTLRESWAREIGSILDTDDEKIEAVLLAMSNGASSAADFSLAARNVYLDKHASFEPLIGRWRTGEIGTNDAYRILRASEVDGIGGTAVAIISMCRDADLADMLAGLARAGHPVWDDVAASWSIPTLGSHVAIGDARARDLLNYLTIDETERLASSIERRDWSDYLERAKRVELAGWNVVYNPSASNMAELRKALEQLRQSDNDDLTGGASQDRG